MCLTPPSAAGQEDVLTMCFTLTLSLGSIPRKTLVLEGKELTVLRKKSCSSTGLDHLSERVCAWRLALHNGF